MPFGSSGGVRSCCQLSHKKQEGRGTVLSYQFRLGHEGIDNSPAAKDLRQSVDNDLEMFICSPKSQTYPELHQKQPGQ